jgi:hypothetical protein
MKNIFGIILIFSISLIKINAQDIPATDNLLIEKFMKSVTSIEKVKIDSDTLAKVFTGAYYQVTTVFTIKDGTSSCESYKLVVKNGDLIELEDLGITKKLDILFSLLRDDFYLKNEGDAKVFETSLDKIYPLGWSDADNKEHLKKGNQWYFVRGKFFDSKKAFIVTLDQNSRISQIDYSLEALKKL